MRRLLRDFGLTLALAALFAFSFGAMIWSGWIAAGEDARMHADIAPTLLAYLGSGDFVSAVFENWESEFLQMAVYVLLTALLFQRGSAESRDPDNPDRDNDDADPGIAGWIYAHSLGLALGALFVASFLLHAMGSWRKAAEAATRHGELPHSLLAHFTSPDLWFESMQNWQSEFLSTGLLVVLSIYLRQKGSPESKPVRAPHAQTGQ